MRPAAVDELREAVEWYSTRSAKAADDLCRRLKQKLDQAAKSLHHWPPRRDGTRQIHLRPFPYLLVVREVKGTLEVVAFAHTSRDLGYWRGRLES
ncbi:MAG: type II toxin-antitoxin system RelE/ParE family toxin [Pirellulaceae bacterium]